MQGTIGAFPSKRSFGQIKVHVAELLKALRENCIDQLNVELCEALVVTLGRVITAISGKCTKNGDFSLLADNEDTIFALIFAAYAFVNAAESEPAKCKEIGRQIVTTVETLDKVLQRGEGRFLIRNTVRLVADLMRRDYANVTKYSAEVKQILLIYQVLSVDELKSLVEVRIEPEPQPKPAEETKAELAIAQANPAETKTDTSETSKDHPTTAPPPATSLAPKPEEKSAPAPSPATVTKTIEDCGYELATKVARQSKDKEVVMKAVTLLELLINKFKASLPLVSEKVVSALGAAFAADIDPKAVVPLRRRVLKLMNYMRKLHPRPLPKPVVRIWLDTGNKAMQMATKDIDFRRESIQSLTGVCDELLEGENKMGVLEAYPELKQLAAVCLEELWNKDEDIRLYSSKCLLDILNHYPAQTVATAKYAEGQVIGLALSQVKPSRESVENVKELVRFEEEAHKKIVGSLEETVEKLVSFAVDEGGAPRDNVVKALAHIMRVQSVYIVKEHMSALAQGFLARCSFLKTLAKEIVG